MSRSKRINAAAGFVVGFAAFSERISSPLTL
jgi:hypothetical protein